MKNRFLVAFRTLIELENLITVIGIVGAAVLTYYSIVNNDMQQALTAVLTVLGTLAISQILANYANAKAKKAIERIECQLQDLSPGSDPPLRRRSQLPSLRSHTNNAKDILVIGRTAVTVLRNRELFEERLREGSTIRIAVINPQNATVLDALMPQDGTREGVAADMCSARSMMERIRKTASNPEQFQLRVFDHVPTMSFFMVNGHLETGTIVAESVPYQVGSTSRPHVFLTPTDTPEWYKYFHDVCEAIWRDSRPVSLDDSSG